jgi:hypothetical protein
MTKKEDCVLRNCALCGKKIWSRRGYSIFMGKHICENCSEAMDENPALFREVIDRDD